MRWQGLATAATVLAVAYAAVTLVTNNLPAAQPQRWAAGDFPNVALTTQDGARVRFYDDLLKGKSVAIDLIYTDCKDECPLETARLVQVQKLLGDRMGKDLFFYSITIDPKHDTPEVLKDYADKFHVGPGWQFLTGDEGTGQWTQRSAEDNPRFMASTIRTYFGWPEEAPGPSYADAKPLDISRGEYVYQTRCVGCHTIGKGDLVGPDLAGVTTRRDTAWLSKYLYAPDQMLADGDPIASALYAKYRRLRMPNLSLSDEDVQAVIAYLNQSANLNPAAPSPD